MNTTNSDLQDDVPTFEEFISCFDSDFNELNIYQELDNLPITFFWLGAEQLDTFDI